MEGTTTVQELISLIEKRPLAFVRHRSLFELEAFINGFNYHRFTGEPGNIDETYNEFIDSWIYSKFGIADKQGWTQAITESCQTEEEAFDKFFALWNEYLSLRDRV